METKERKWSQEDLQRVLFHLVMTYRNAVTERGTLFDEFLHSAIVDVAIPTLKDNNWWPEDEGLQQFFDLPSAPKRKKKWFKR